MAYALEFVGLIGRKCVPILIATSNLLVTNKLCLIQRITSYELLNIKSGKWKRLKLPYVSLIFLQSVKIYGKTKPTLVVLSYYYVFFFSSSNTLNCWNKKEKVPTFDLKSMFSCIFTKLIILIIFFLFFDLIWLFYLTTIRAHSQQPTQPFLFLVWKVSPLVWEVGSWKSCRLLLRWLNMMPEDFFFFFFINRHLNSQMLKCKIWKCACFSLRQKSCSHVPHHICASDLIKVELKLGTWLFYLTWSLCLVLQYSANVLFFSSHSYKIMYLPSTDTTLL